MGWAMSFSPDSRLTMKALKMAWETLGKPVGVIFHSDQGGHYVSIPARGAEGLTLRPVCYAVPWFASSQ